MKTYIQKNNHFPDLPERLQGLGELAENLWWSWNPQARMLFKTLDRQTWKESGHNPDLMLKMLPTEVLQRTAQDKHYLTHYDLVMYHFRKYMQEPQICPQDKPGTQALPIAYFSAEYGLHHSLPFYAGGLGFLAGDHLKECSDLGVPLVAVGFMYPAGYLYQVLRQDGWQENYTQEVDKEAASISRLLTENGEQLQVSVPYINHTPVQVGIWKVAVGRVPLYLMDTDLEVNDSWIRGISHRLYTSDHRQRLLQEIILGIGGSRVLRALGQDYCMLHLNEGHAAFALLEKIRELVETGQDFEQARERLKDMSLFTTHTPVPAGHDVFPFELIEHYFQGYWPRLGLGKEEFLDLGRHPEDPQAGFNMTVLALKLSGQANAVSRKHCQVTRQMWQSLWPDLPQEEIPIDYVTNGVHLPTWLEPKIRLLFNRHFGEGWLSAHEISAIWEFIEEIPAKELWQTHYWLKLKLFNYIRHRAKSRWSSGQTDPGQIMAQGTMLDPAVLTIGFARRFATYKRADLIFSDLERLKKILNHPWRPIQIVFAGKAHPADEAGQRLIQRIYHLARSPELGGRVAFVENYNEQLAQYLVHGVDVWLNNPQPPLEACGTSGMKAAINGVPQLSIPDGWWLEAFNRNNGWTFGHEEPGTQRDQEDAQELYQLLENKLIPAYYQAEEDGTPFEWVRIMKESIKSVAPAFSSRRMVKEYIQKFYYNPLHTEPGSS
jgi:starch phosphorylase